MTQQMIESRPLNALLEVETSFNSLVALCQGNSDYRAEEPFFKQQFENYVRTIP